MDESPRCWLHRELTEKQALAIGGVMAATWQKPGKDAAYRAAAMLKAAQNIFAPEPILPRSFVLLEGDEVVAHAAMYPREIVAESGPLWILGLSGVCTAPGRRGKGLGAKIVRAAFAMINDSATDFCLFQTSHEVRPFYEWLGACLVENQIYDSTAEQPNTSPFWDEVAMRYPAGTGWPEGPIDLRGPGY